MASTLLPARGLQRMPPSSPTAHACAHHAGRSCRLGSRPVLRTVVRRRLARRASRPLAPSRPVCALTGNYDLAVGARAPDFVLPDTVSGKNVSLSDLRGKPALLVMFLCVHCPYVIHLKEAIARLTSDLKEHGLETVAISSNSTRTHPQDAPEHMAADANKYGWQFPYLFDETQEVAKAFSAACTPEFYVFDADLKLRYHGQFDDSRPRNSQPVTGVDLEAAIHDVLAGRDVKQPIKPSIGCSIKWHPGNEP